MPSKIKQFNFNGCKHLKKIVISQGVEFEGKIDLSDTPITAKNDIQKVNVIDSELEDLGTPNIFKDAPDGITANPEKLKLAKLKGVDVEIQTDPISIHVEGVHLSEWDKRAIERMKGSLFWFDILKQSGKREYLEQRRDELKIYISNNPARDNLNDVVRRLGEEILFIIEKILENSDAFNDLGHISPDAPTNEPRAWKTFYKFLTMELFKADGLLWRFRTDNEIKEQLRNELKTRLNATSDNLSEWLKNNISEKAIDRFFNTLEATLDKDGSKYYTFPDYDDDWNFDDYYNNNTKFIGFKPTKEWGNEIRFNNKSMSESAEKVLTVLFQYWKEVYSGNTPPPTSETPTGYYSLNINERQAIRNIYQKGSYDNWKELENNANELKAVLEQINENIRTFKKYGTIDRIKEN